MIKNTIAKKLKETLKSYTDVKGCMEALEQHLQVSEKFVGATMWNRLANMRYNGSKGVREHIVEMVNLTKKLKEVNMTMADELLSQIALDSLSSSFDPFIIAYNPKKQKWSINEINVKCNQEEKMMNNEGTLVVSHVSHKFERNIKGKNKLDGSVKEEIMKK